MVGRKEVQYCTHILTRIPTGDVLCFQSHPIIGNERVLYENCQNFVVRYAIVEGWEWQMPGIGQAPSCGRLLH